MGSGRKPNKFYAGLLQSDVVADLDRVTRYALRQIRRLFVLLIGVTVVLIGVVMLFTPGPAVVVIPVGLGILAIEFAWARLLLRRFRERAQHLGKELRGKLGRGAEEGAREPGGDPK